MTTSLDAPTDLPESGQIPYGPRAALQDTALAMGKDVMRALVEDITNASDSYGGMARRGEDVGDGRIDILVERRHDQFHRILIRDHAAGLRRDEICSRVLQMGERHADSLDRGFMGRGAKDAAFFGRAIYETIKDGVFSQATIHPDQHYDGLLPERPALPEDYARLGLHPGSSGTQVTLLVERNRFSIPRQENMRRRLERNVQLRQILSSPDRRVRLHDLGRADQPPVAISFQFPIERTECLRVPLALTVYPEARGELVLQRLDHPIEDDRGSERLSGIVIEDGTAVHEATYFGCEGRPGALLYVGTLHCPYIRTLLDDYDVPARRNHLNPTPVVTRSRTGLDHDHPFVKALAGFVERQLLPLVQAEEEEQASHGGKETPETHERLRTAARELGRRFVEEMRRMEAEVSGQGADASLPPRPVRLRVIPPRVFIEPEGTAVLTVQSWPEAFGEDPPPEPWVASLRVDDEMVATLPEGEVSLELDPRDPSRRRGAFEVHAGAGEDVTMVDIRLGTASEVAVIEVAAASEEPPVAPNRLMFANGSCRVPPNRPKRLILMAPPELVGKAGPLARLTVTHEAVTIPAQARLEYRQADDGRSWYEAEIEVSMPAGLTARLRASLGGQIASCALASAGAAGRVPFQFLLSDDDPPRYDAQGRAEWIHPHGVPTLKIFTRHRSLRPAFGERMEHQEELTCRLLIAEVLASEIALHTIRESRAQLAGSSREAAELFGSRFKEQQTRYLRVAYGVLAPELTELPAGSR